MLNINFIFFTVYCFFLTAYCFLFNSWLFPPNSMISVHGYAIEPDPMQLLDGVALTLSALRKNMHNSRNKPAAQAAGADPNRTNELRSRDLSS